MFMKIRYTFYTIAILKKTDRAYLSYFIQKMYDSPSSKII